MTHFKRTAFCTSSLVALLAGGFGLATPAAAQIAQTTPALAPAGTAPGAPAPAPGQAIPAQDGTDGTSVGASDPDAANGEIVVTARKRAESILRTPVAVTALNSEALAVRGVTTLNDVAAFTPGVNVNNNAAGRNDRSFQQVIIRGFTPSAATNPTTSLFIDGVPVSSPSAFSAISDPERIEILKGPQSAYFGRNTFAGAVNVVNKLPGNVLAGSVGGLIGTRDTYKIHADIEGPLIGDILSFRISGDRVSKNGSYENTFVPGQTLGDQQTTSGTALLVFKPTTSLTIKAFGLLSRDDDGPPAQGLISAYTLTNPAGAVVVPGQSNCTLTGSTSAVQSLGRPIANPFFCGVAPRLISGPSANTANNSFVKNFLAAPNGRIIAPEDGVQGYGLLRNYYHLHLAADWEIGDTGLTLSSLTGYNNEKYSQISDLDNYGDTSIPNNGFGPVAAGAQSYFDFPYLVERVNRDFSQEFRASYDNNGRFRLNVGASYLNNFVQGGLGGGNGALGTTIFSIASGATRNRTYGAFFGASYSVTDKLTINLEGRYQIDKLYAYAQPGGLTATTNLFVPTGFYAGGAQILTETYKNFLPRVIAQYQATPEVMYYASYSKGINPGLFNTAFLTFSPTLQRAASDAGIKVAVAPEKVTNYEIGVKGRFFDNRVRVSLDAYIAPWRDQINAITVNALDPTNNSFQIVRGSANTGSVDMRGIELDGTITATRDLDINFGAAINDSSINQFQNATVSTTTGVFDYSGKENPNTSKYSATFGAQYGGKVRGHADTSWFARGDYVFKSGVWSDAANVVRTPAFNLVNTRLGIRQGGVSLEAFVNNVFNTRAYTTIADASVFTNNFRYSTYSSSLIVGLPDLRTYGLQARYRF